MSKRGKTKSIAWKKIVKDHKRGPKRVRMKRELTTEEENEDGADVEVVLSQFIQLIIDKGRRREYVIIKISETALQKLRLRNTHKLLPNHTKKHDLYPTFHALDHNSIVMGLRKLIPLRIHTYCGPYVCEALVYGGRIKKPKTTIHILNTKEHEEEIMKTDKYVESLFSNHIRSQAVVQVEIEYM
tara:strand:- start:934 stop:1488 length:555 start_codon:yes stop_codon:yes gene_type:complete